MKSLKTLVNNNAMAENTKIEWAHHTANLWHGCTHVHTGCDMCYAETLSNRWGNNIWGNDKPRKEIKSVWKDLDRYQKLAAKSGEIHRVFVGSMMDIFEKPMPLINNNGNEINPTTINVNSNSISKEWIGTDFLRYRLFNEIENGFYPNLLFLFLTKRPSNINKYIFESWKTNPPANVMFGTSVVNQETANKLIPQLLEVNGKRFLSCEPLLGPIDFSTWLKDWSCKKCNGTGVSGFGMATRRCEMNCYTSWNSKIGINWVIVGGESGHNARPMHPDWVRSIHKQCADANVPFFFKQWGEWKPNRLFNSLSEIDDDVEPFPKGKVQMINIKGVHDDKILINGIKEPLYRVVKVGKRNSGAFLDGKECKEFPNK